MDLEHAFRQVAARLALEQTQLNQVDEINHNHGDHMVEIFNLVAQVIGGHHGETLASMMNAASGVLLQQQQNGSAQVYGRGLTLLAEQFRQQEIEINDLVAFTRRQLNLADSVDSTLPDSGKRNGELVKGLLEALSTWDQAEASAENANRQKSSGLDLGYLFGLGMAYMQAKRSGGSRAATIAETVVAASPLSKQPHRERSAKLAIQTLLEALSDDLED